MTWWNNGFVRGCIGFGVAMGAPCVPEILELLDPAERRD